MKIGNQLTAGAFGIGAIVLVNLGVILLSSQSDAKVINLSGVVRGATQRSIKLELSNNPNDKLIAKLDNLIAGLINGSEELELPQATDPEYIARMQEAQEQWNKSKTLIQAVRNNPTDFNRAALLTESEKLFELTNAAVNAAQAYSEANLQQLRIIQLFVALLNFIILALIITGSRRITNTLDRFTNTIARSSDDIASNGT